MRMSFWQVVCLVGLQITGPGQSPSAADLLREHLGRSLWCPHHPYQSQATTSSWVPFLVSLPSNLALPSYELSQTWTRAQTPRMAHKTLPKAIPAGLSSLGFCQALQLTASHNHSSFFWKHLLLTHVNPSLTTLPFKSPAVRLSVQRVVGVFPHIYSTPTMASTVLNILYQVLHPKKNLW